MVLIQGTNILVDDFDPNRQNRGRYTLDCYRGIDQTWKNETIYCSEETKALLVDKFTNLTKVITFGLNTDELIYLDEKKEMYVWATFFDANHCTGSVMVLFKGYMGTILYTGDFRFNHHILEEFTVLYPSDKRKINNIECSLPVDELILDNTFCDPTFKFPKKSHVFKAVTKIIDKNPGKSVCIVLNSLGKEELLIHLAIHCETKVLVDKARYEALKLANYYYEWFTTDPKNYKIRVIRRSQIKKRLEKGALVFFPTGWCNDVCVELEPNYYVKRVIGYSLHSNYKEICEFVESIKPAKLTPIYPNEDNKIPLNKLDKTELNQFQRLKYMKQSGLASLKSKFTNRTKFSDYYKTYLKVKNLTAMQNELGIGPGSSVKVEAIGKQSASKGKKSIKKEAGKGPENVLRILDEEEMKTDNVKIEETEFGEQESMLLDKDIPGTQEEEEMETWQKIFRKDQKKFKQSKAESLTPEELQLLETIQKQPNNEIPFSDESDSLGAGDDGEDRMSVEEDQIPQEGNFGTLLIPTLEEGDEIKPHKLYSGIITLTIPSRSRGQKVIRESFDMFTAGEQKSVDIPNDINFEEVVSYKEVEPFIREIVQEEYSSNERSFVVGWVKGEKEGVDSVFEALAEHMKKYDVARCYKISAKSKIYFLHSNQLAVKMPDTSSMVFLIVFEN